MPSNIISTDLASLNADPSNTRTVNKFAKVALTTLCLMALTACASGDGMGEDGRDSNRGMKTGAAGGAILGLAMGAVAGDAGMALKGAAIGAAAGGVAGAGADYANDREDYRNENATKSININGLPGTQVGVASQAPATPQNWDRLDTFSGQWQVNIWALDSQGKRVEATGVAQGGLSKTTAATLSVENLAVSGVKQDLTGQVELSYSPELGYQLQTDFNGNKKLNFSGEYQPQLQRYNYYPVGVNGQTYSGNERSQMRIELRFAGKDVFLVDSYAVVDGQEVQIQSYRFTRQG
ncbi:hypothetical protein CXF83_20345 [Shewanella sp. Choline-02u-19]|jgi:hypothetical protein|uniref:hypothetical protein n=1 Tax=unclassified Shewanella TaxID=196818 RepID=UPI000C328D1B|nr:MULTISPECIES: hypothetical protein [unclassified Shewanella]PKG56311.1 hypothetical protein CXF82_15560 [Shewanella sp. GutDb-MelDb]PKG74478.1 hypothetical protein CXF86_11940 [Shewanella sp. GutCb]PKH53863.1 hypothetical protein CXF84_21575 [Shewanella sp. Bg11-22]PKI28885.1 hypothetical protein CXF83_20345 [Shewanella sp. Choline-02u-19]